MGNVEVQGGGPACSRVYESTIDSPLLDSIVGAAREGSPSIVVRSGDSIVGLLEWKDIVSSIVARPDMADMKVMLAPLSNAPVLREGAGIEDIIESMRANNVTTVVVRDCYVSLDQILETIDPKSFYKYKLKSIITPYNYVEVPSNASVMHVLHVINKHGFPAIIVRSGDGSILKFGLKEFMDSVRKEGAEALYNQVTAHARPLMQVDVGGSLADAIMIMRELGDDAVGVSSRGRLVSVIYKMDLLDFL